MPGQAGREAYDNLQKHFIDILTLHSVTRILNKDQETAMAPGSMAGRIQQFMVISKVMHDLMIDPAIPAWLQQAEQNRAALSPEENRNLALMRDYLDDNAMPAWLVQEKARLANEGQWHHTRLSSGGDWANIKDWYQHSFDTMREIGRDKQMRRGFSSIYEALLDTYCPGMNALHVAQELDRLEWALPPLIQAARHKQSLEPPPLPLRGPFPAEQQAVLCRRIAAAMGFDFNRGRFDFITGHPSTRGGPDDTRFTVRCNEQDFLATIYTAIHETGHALYLQNLPVNWNYQPAGTYMGMAIHESQSRIMEMQACMIPEFFEFLEKEARAVFGRPSDPALSAENLRKLKHRVEPSFIRTRADELTYPAHIILRHKLEKDIIEGARDVKDLPQAWNDGMRTLLGITPPDHARGCMQDVHWPIGAIGYFPAYTLGDMGAAQFFDQACKDRPEIRGELGNGNFTPLREWLRDHVHSKGSLLTPDELFVQATGEKLNAGHYLDHLSRRYLGRPYFTPAPALPGAGAPPPVPGP